MAVFQHVVPAPPPGPPSVIWSLGDAALLARTPGGTSVLGFMPVVPITLISALLLVLGSWLTPKPSTATLARYFPDAVR